MQCNGWRLTQEKFNLGCARSQESGTRGRRHPCAEQLQRAALSVQLNIAEGYALRSPKRFRNHLDIAYASAVETSDLLEISSSLGLLDTGLAEATLGRCRRCQQLIRGLISRIRREQHGK